MALAAAATIASVYEAPALLRAVLAAVMSTSRETENCGASRHDRLIRSAIALRMRESGSLRSPSCAAARLGTDFEVAAASTSSRVTRPPGPLPPTAVMSTPSSCARLRAAGDERTLSPSDGEGEREGEASDALGA